MTGDFQLPPTAKRIIEFSGTAEVSECYFFPQSTGSTTNRVEGKLYPSAPQLRGEALGDEHHNQDTGQELP